MIAVELARALQKAEEAHKASGHDAAGWSLWYAEWLLNHHPELFRGTRGTD